MVYGYARVSTGKQSISRQLDNIKRIDETATIYQEAYTGTTTDRPQWNKLLSRVKAGDTIIFDEVSRMSRNADEGFKAYEKLYSDGIELVFIKEPYLNTSTYKTALDQQISIAANTGREAIDEYISDQGKAINKLLLNLAREQIKLAFKSAEDEVQYLHKRTSEGVRRAQAEGKLVGRSKGATVTTKKGKEVTEKILKYSRDFNGVLSDADLLRDILKVDKHTYYKYKAQLKEERSKGNEQEHQQR